MTSGCLCNLLLKCSSSSSSSKKNLSKLNGQESIPRIQGMGLQIRAFEQKYAILGFALSRSFHFCEYQQLLKNIALYLKHVNIIVLTRNTRLVLHFPC